MITTTTALAAALAGEGETAPRLYAEPMPLPETSPAVTEADRLSWSVELWGTEYETGEAFDDMLADILARAVRVRGGNAQLVLGG